VCSPFLGQTEFLHLLRTTPKKAIIKKLGECADMTQIINFKLEDFEGPLDLLLSLVQKNKMDLANIEIVTLINQYLEIIKTHNNTLDSQSEFISMAARLVQLKSAMLLPKSEEAQRMREELSGLLIEYSACKQIAQQLGKMAAGVFIAVRKPQKITLDMAYKGKHSVNELENVFFNLIGKSTARRMPSQERFDEIVAAPVVSVQGRVIYLLRGILGGAINNLHTAFAKSRTRSETVATFLALLELVRSGRINVLDNETLVMKNKTHKQKEDVIINGN
jgi:segregation and condensation protein A